MAACCMKKWRLLLVSFSIAVLMTVPAAAFTANSLEITVGQDGDAIAVFSFTLEGLVENAIPQSVLEDQLLKGLSTSSEPPELISMDRSSATIRMKKFADTFDVPTGTEYRTASMNFKKAEIALQESALSSVITADFSPTSIKVTFPDKYERTFASSDVLPSITHIIVDPAKAQAAAAASAASGAVITPATNGAIKVVSSPEGALITLDGQVVGNAPAILTDIPAGSHTLEFSKEQYEPVSKTITVKAGQTVQVSVFLSYLEQTPAQQSPGFSLFLAIGVLCAGLIFRLRR